MFVNDIEVLHPYNNEKIMQIHDNRLIAECTSYDFKEMLERKKVKSWLKSKSVIRKFCFLFARNILFLRQ